MAASFTGDWQQAGSYLSGKLTIPSSVTAPRVTDLDP